MEGTLVTRIPFPSSIKVDCFRLTFRLSIPLSSMVGPIEKSMTKVEMLQL
jgi:hypothetical protein